MEKNTEKVFMYLESNSKNIENFEKLFPYFFYDSSTKKRVLKSIEERSYLDELFHLNEQKRLWFNFESCDYDESYKLYRTLINEKDLNPLVDDLQGNAHLLINYDTFKDNKLVVKKQNVKLFKYLKNKKILSQEEIERITSAKSNTDLYFCISRNIIDYIFVSTGQSFSTCVNMQGSYPFWLGLPAFITDPSRFLLFVSKGKISRTELRGIPFKYFKYLSRTWGLISDSDTFVTIRSYPNDNFCISELFAEACSVMNINIKKFDPNREFVSKFSFKAPYLENGTLALPYIDRYGYNIRDDIIKWADCGSCGCPIDFNNRTIDEIESLDDCQRFCDSCGCHVPEDYEYYDDYSMYCEECYYDIYNYCDWCENTFAREDGYTIINNETVCNYCFDHNGFMCEDCDEPFHNDDMSDLEYICINCRQNYEKCGCGEIVPDDEIHEIEGEFFCNRCYENLQVRKAIEMRDGQYNSNTSSLGGNYGIKRIG